MNQGSPLAGLSFFVPFRPGNKSASTPLPLQCSGPFLQGEVKAQMPFRAVRPRLARPVAACAREPRAGQAGQGLVEYALILIMVSVVAIFIIVAMGPALIKLFSNVVTSLAA